MVFKAEATVRKEPGEKNFSCYLYVPSLKTSVLGLGPSVKAAMADMNSGWEDALAEFKEEGKEEPSLDISYKFDIGALFNYYDFISMSGVSREIGINPSLMRQYAMGARNPSEKKKKEIANGLKRLASKMQAVAFC